jgi:hypothetical protein
MKENYRKAFEDLGIDKVRRFVNNASSTGEKLEQALLWINEKDFEQQRAFMARSEIKMADQMRVGQRALNLARIASVLAAVAVLLSIIALLY